MTDIKNKIKTRKQSPPHAVSKIHEARKKYKRKKVAAYVINGASALLMGVALIPLDQFLAGFIGGLVGTQLYSLPVHLFAKVNFSESLLIYYSEIKKIEN